MATENLCCHLNSITSSIRGWLENIRVSSNSALVDECMCPFFWLYTFKHAQKESCWTVYSSLNIKTSGASKSAFVPPSWIRSHRTGWPCPPCLPRDASLASGSLPTCCFPLPAKTCRPTSRWTPSCATMLSQWYYYLPLLLSLYLSYPLTLFFFFSFVYRSLSLSFSFSTFLNSPQCFLFTFSHPFSILSIGIIVTFAKLLSNVGNFGQ